MFPIPLKVSLSGELVVMGSVLSKVESKLDKVLIKCCSGGLTEFWLCEVVLEERGQLQRH